MSPEQAVLADWANWLASAKATIVVSVDGIVCIDAPAVESDDAYSRMPDEARDSNYWGI